MNLLSKEGKLKAASGPEAWDNNQTWVLAGRVGKKKRCTASKEHGNGEKLRIRIKPGWRWFRLTGRVELKKRIKAFNEKLLQPA